VQGRRARAKLAGGGAEARRACDMCDTCHALWALLRKQISHLPLKLSRDLIWDGGLIADRPSLALPRTQRRLRRRRPRQRQPRHPRQMSASVLRNLKTPPLGRTLGPPERLRRSNSLSHLYGGAVVARRATTEVKFLRASGDSRFDPSPDKRL